VSDISDLAGLFATIDAGECDCRRQKGQNFAAIARRVFACERAGGL
jgi:hypothetical protein